MGFGVCFVFCILWMAGSWWLVVGGGSYYPLMGTDVCTDFHGYLSEHISEVISVYQWTVV